MAQVSVVIPVYNIAPHLHQCLDSVLSQTLHDIEVICVDDGSTDESPEILKAYAQKDERVQVISQENAGPGVARNTGMKGATGEYLIFLDSDDWFELDFLEKMVRKAKETNADVVICRSVEFDNNTGEELPSDWMLKTEFLPGDEFSPEDAAAHIFQFTYGWPWDKLYRMDFVRKKGLSYPPLRNSEDLVFVFQSIALAERIAVLRDVFIHHRVKRMTSVSNSRYLAPDVPYLALSLFRRSLEEQKVYSIFEQSFLIWAMEFLIWNVANMGERRAQQVYYRKLKQEWLPELKFEAHGASYYRDRFTYCKYLLVRYAPYPVFDAVLRAYKNIAQRRRR